MGDSGFEFIFLSLGIFFEWDLNKGKEYLLSFENEGWGKVIAVVVKEWDDALIRYLLEQDTIETFYEFW